MYVLVIIGVLASGQSGSYTTNFTGLTKERCASLGVKAVAYIKKNYGSKVSRVSFRCKKTG